jgi:hypothetical protein
MNLLKIIPKDDRWVVSKNIVYIDYISKIPILVKAEDKIWVYLDIRISKYVVKLVSILEQNNINFLFKSTLIFFDKKHSIEEFNEYNLIHFIKSITNEKFFDGFHKVGFDYTKSISDYLLEYKCYDTFSEVYNKQKKELLSKEYDYWQNLYFYRVKREDIRNYISSLEREIKISLLF